jgi:uncharacterized protein Veg
MIIQFLIREKTIHTIALYKDVNVEGVDRNLEELLTITREVGRKKRSLKLGPLIVVLAPVLF